MGNRTEKKSDVERALDELEREFDEMCDRFEDSLVDLRLAIRDHAKKEKKGGGPPGDQVILGWLVKHLNSPDDQVWYTSGGWWRSTLRECNKFSIREEAIEALRSQRRYWSDIHPEWRFGLVRIVPRGSRGKKKGGK
jgi:hypothetical protein